MINGEMVQVALLILTNKTSHNNCISLIDASLTSNPSKKAFALISNLIDFRKQLIVTESKNSIVHFATGDISKSLGDYSSALRGLSTGESNRFIHRFWELDNLGDEWEGFQTDAEVTSEYTGRSEVIFWQQEKGVIYELSIELKHLNHSIQSWKRGKPNWGKSGIAINLMGGLYSSFYSGDRYSADIGVIIPNCKDDMAALWCFCSSSEFVSAVRSFNQKVSVEPRYFELAEIDFAYWQKVAAEKYPLGLPKPHSNDPKQWLFNGHPKGSEQPLHVAVARLLGYHWPRQTGSSFPDCPSLGPDGLESYADEDGIVCMPPVNREQPAASRLRQLLTAALGPFDERALIAAAGPKGSKSKTLEEWLCDEFFEQHAKLFHDRPFIWHLWDGRSDGFHALVNYHKLDHAALQKLTYSYLGNWIQDQAEDARNDKPGAAARLGAARALQTKLAAILEGEAPLDIFVRWKSVKDQAQGWNPDINDGIRQNIRPFLFAGDVGKRGAGLFRSVPLKLKDKDRGTEPQRPKSEYPWFWCEETPGTDPVGGKLFVGNRWNEVHLTLAYKKMAGK